MQIPPIDGLIREGFIKQLIKQFRCPAVAVSSPDKLRNLQTLQGNAQPRYPHIFVTFTTTSANQESYVTHKLARQGIPVVMSDDGVQMKLAKLIPVKFDAEITFRTNKESSSELDSVEGFQRRWMFARRLGSLNFNVDYGISTVAVSYTMADSLSLTPRENPTDAESIYEIVASATVNGYLSEPTLSTRGIINSITLTTELPGAGDIVRFDDYKSCSN